MKIHVWCMLSIVIAGMPACVSEIEAGGYGAAKEAERRQRACARVMQRNAEEYAIPEERLGTLANKLKSRTMSQRDRQEMCSLIRDHLVPLDDRTIARVVDKPECDYPQEPIAKALVENTRKVQAARRKLYSQHCEGANAASGLGQDDEPSVSNPLSCVSVSKAGTVASNYNVLNGCKANIYYVISVPAGRGAKNLEWGYHSKAPTPPNLVISYHGEPNVVWACVTGAAGCSEAVARAVAEK